MLSILKIFVLVLCLVLLVSAVSGLVAFFKDLHDFKSEKQLSLPRKKLILALLQEEELKNKAVLTSLDYVEDGEENAI